MNDDGAIDFSGFSLDELREAAQAIRRDKYPQNYERLMAELASRDQLPEPPLDVSNDQSLWGRVWDADQADGSAGSARGWELFLLVALFVAAILAQDHYFDPLFASLGVPAGRWLQFFYYTLGGTAIAGLFYFVKRRNLNSEEVSIVAIGSVGVAWALEVVGYFVLVNYSGQSGCGIGCIGFTMAAFLGLDLLLMYLAWRFPIRLIVRLVTV